jgi:predicted acylesterase/phospholipase RssA
MTTGGQYGSFSSGFLTGWGARARDARPDFAVVTGASAGGIVAPLVFAGRAFDDRLTLNTGIGEADVVRKRAVLELLGASSLFSTAPLRQSVEAAVDEALITAIGARWADGNDLFLGATNLDRGRFDLFDIGAFMADGAVPLADKRDCLVSAVMATSAIPALFPPQRINGDLYTDAGVRQSVFLQGVRDGIAESQAVLGVRVRVNAYVIVNGDLEVPEVRTETGLLGVAGRTFQLVSDEGLRQSLVETADLARDAGWRLRAVRAPDFESLGCGADDALFSACVTRALFASGERLALQDEIDWLDGAALRRIARRY